jgi:hypothetical protein
MKKIVYTKALINLIAGCIFDGLTDEETGLLAGVSGKQIGRLRAGDDCRQIKLAVIERMRKYIALIRDGEDRSNRWQRIAWFLERRYPDRWAKPEVLLNVSNNTANTTNNTLVITAEVAENLRTRNANLDQDLQKLVPPASRTGPIIPIMSPEHISSASSKGDPITSQVSNETESIDVVETPPPAPAGGTPYAAAEGVEPNLTPNSNYVENSRNYSEKSVENSRNYNKSSSNSNSALEKIVMGTKGNPPKTGPLGEKLPTKREIRERKAAAEAELAELKEKKKRDAPPLSKERRPRVPPKVLPLRARGPKSGRKK